MRWRCVAPSRSTACRGLCLTKLDVLDGLETVKLCVGYKDANGELLACADRGRAATKVCEPVYEEMPGWSGSRWAPRTGRLPANARAYIKRIEELVGAPIDIISTGPDRNETIVMRHPYA